MLRVYQRGCGARHRTDSLNTVENTCYKCGAPVQEGTAFCPHCNAPQIRVSVPESDSPSFEPGTPAEMQPPARPVLLTPNEPLSPTAIDWSAGAKPVVIAGILSGFCFFLPLNLLWVVLGGVLAVFLYNRRRPPYLQISAGTGAKLGAVTGVVGYALFAIFAVIGFVFANEKLWAELDLALRQKAGPNPDVSVQQLFEILKTAEGKAVIAVCVMVFAFALFLGLATIGGAIAASLVRREEHLPR